MSEVPLQRVPALHGLRSTHANPYVGVSRVRSWSRLFVLGAISWAFIAKY